MASSFRILQQHLDVVDVDRRLAMCLEGLNDFGCKDRFYVISVLYIVDPLRTLLKHLIAYFVG